MLGSSCNGSDGLGGVRDGVWVTTRATTDGRIVWISIDQPFSVKVCIVTEVTVNGVCGIKEVGCGRLLIRPARVGDLQGCAPNS
jgi:hypothetical protein